MTEKSERDVGRVGIDPLYKGLTRPPMLFGLITYNWGLVIFLATSMLAINFPSLYDLVFGAALFAVAYLICAREPKFLDLVRIGAQVTVISWANREHHGNTASYDEF